MKRKLFCEISPFTYELSLKKERFIKNIQDYKSHQTFAHEKSIELLPFLIYKHKSLIRRTLGNVDMTLQENKATNLNLAAPKINHIIIKPNEVFSFWKLVGSTNKSDGYLQGLTISKGGVSKAIGGGMCQMTNLIHWMILHTPLIIIEHHHHDKLDLFPDFNRQIPFGTGTSIMYNFKDYRFINPTDSTYQLNIYTTNEYLCGELRSNKKLDSKYHIYSENNYFSKEDNIVYRNGKVFRKNIDLKTGNTLFTELIRINHAKVMYDTSGLDIEENIK